MGTLEGKVVLISGAGRGQGRSHAVRFAQEGAAIIAFDRCADVATVDYPLATVEDLETTARLVRDTGGRIVTGIADVRMAAEITAVLDKGVSEFGGLDIVLANAGVVEHAPFWELDDDTFQNVIDINLIGAWKTAKAAAAQLIERKGVLILTSSGLGIKGATDHASYVASKHGIIGLMRALAKELAPYGARVNAVLPGVTDTDMIQSPVQRRLHVPGVDDPSPEQLAEATGRGIPMRIPWVEPLDVSEAALWLASDAARFVTGVAFPVDGGSAIP